METMDELHNPPIKNSELLENLNAEQARAVTHAAGPLLIVAGAGTGKTTVISKRIAWLVSSGLARLDEIAALTFTEKAATEMQSRVDLLLPLGHYDSWICTFHGFCERILKTHGLDIGLPGDFKLIDTVRLWVLVYRNLDRFKLDYYKPLGSPAKFIDAMLRHFSRCKDELITPEEYLKYADSLVLNQDSAEGLPGQVTDEADEAETLRVKEIAGAYQTYQQLLLENNCLDFADLISYTLQLFKKRPNILKLYQRKFKQILVDEFQDTNLAQYELIKLLAGDTKNLVVVGDDDQSIYKFRGASVSNIMKFKDDFPDLKEITLVENYRSSQAILDLAYNFVRKNDPDRLEVKLNIDKKLKSNTPEPAVIEVLEERDLPSELAAIAAKITELKNASGDSWNEFAVLARSNSAAEEVIPVFAAAGIPYTYVANRGLYRKSVIVDLLSYLKLLDNAHNSASLYRVLNFPKFALNISQLSALLEFAQKKALSLFSALQQAASLPALGSGALEKINGLLKCLSEHSQKNRTASAAEMAVVVLRDLGFEQILEEDTRENAEARELIDQFYKKIEKFEREETDRSLHNFLNLLELEQVAGNEGEIEFDPNLGPESVKIMTVHSAKGLEFKYVFVINLVEQRFPTREKSDTIEIPEALVKDILPEGDFHLQEERRLFYVALTRAKRNLYLTWATDYGGAKTKRPSMFLVEAGLESGEKTSQATGKVLFHLPVGAKEVYQNLPRKFSFSQLMDFQTCPLKYKYKDYLKLPVPGSCHTSFGQTMHKVFEEYLNEYKRGLESRQADLFGGSKEMGQIPGFELLEKLYEKSWVDDWYRDEKEKESYRRQGRKILKIFYDEVVNFPPKPKYIEKFFHLNLGEFEFVGKIDRVDEVEGGIMIWDYKTGKPKADKELDQLYIYQWAAEEFLREKVVGLNYWFLKDNIKKPEAPAKPEKVEKLKAELLELMQKIVHTTRYDLFKEEHKKVRDHNCEFLDLEK